jgi:hypothetical protein
MRSPITHKDAPAYRLCSMPNGLWQLQRDQGFRGNPKQDPWEAVNRPTTLEEAKRQLASRFRLP